MRRSPFEIDDDDWKEYVEEMEDIPLSLDEESDENHPQIFEQGGMVRIQNSKGEGISITPKHYRGVMKRLGFPCPLCKGGLSFSVSRNSMEKKISVFRLWCERCDRTFEVILGDICLPDE